MLKTARYDSLCQWYWEAANQKFLFDTSADWRLLKYQIAQESSFDPEAVSHAGARGLLQIMPGTWGEGFEMDAFNPEKNIARGVDHLGQMWQIFKAEKALERWRFALGAYNAGPGWIIKSQAICKARGRPTDRWDEIVLVIPGLTGENNARETAGYVATIVRNFKEGRDL